MPCTYNRIIYVSVMHLSFLYSLQGSLGTGGSFSCRLVSFLLVCSGSNPLFVLQMDRLSGRAGRGWLAGSNPGFGLGFCNFLYLISGDMFNPYFYV